MVIQWLYDIPDWLLAVLVMGTLVVLSAAGVVATRPVRSRAMTNDVAGAVLATVGLIHGILLALIAVAAWNNYTAASNAAEREAGALASMLRHADGYPEPARQRLQMRLRAYVELVINDEWPALRRGRVSERTIQARDALAREWVAFQPTSTHEQVLYAATARELKEFLDARQARLIAGRTGLPAPLWAVALLGSVLTIGCTYLFRVNDERMQHLLTAAVAAMLGLVLYVILVLDHPVWGVQGIKPDPFTSLWQFMLGR